VSVEQLQAGNEVLTPEGQWRGIRHIERVSEKLTVHNFEVADNHDYFVGRVGILVHNQCVNPSSKTVAKAEKALANGATEVTVKSEAEAGEVFLRNYQGDGYKNTTGMHGADVRNDKFLFPDGKMGTYHWEVPDPNHGNMPHLQVHLPKSKGGKIIRIKFPFGK
jgi:hypothetical protein